jgi:hypothetical protein
MTRQQFISTFRCAALILFGTPSWGDEPNPEIVSLLTLVAEQDQVENPKANLRGNVTSVDWEQVRVERTRSGSTKEVFLHSKFTRYDAEGHAVEKVDRESSSETRTINDYTNGALVSMRGRAFSKDTDRPIGEEFWQTFRYDAAGQLIEMRRGRGQKLENHFIQGYASGRLTRREVRQGTLDVLIYTEEFHYMESPLIVERRILLPNGSAKRSTRLRLDSTNKVVELWDEEGYHVRWVYDDRGRVIEQLTDTYRVPDGCDSCPLPGKVQTQYEDSMRTETFFGATGKAVLRRITKLERDGFFASIGYERLPGARPQDAPDLYRVVDAIIPPGGNRYVESAWDDHGNWTEKREYFQPKGRAPTLQFVYRRRILYR